MPEIPRLNLDRLKKFCTDNNLSRDQVYELFELIKDIQSDTINQCRIMVEGAKK